MTEVTSFGENKNSVNGNVDPVERQVFRLDDGSPLLYDTFPEGFKFGCGSSALQIEGGWNADGKGLSTWDTLCQNNPKAIDDGSTCEITCDSYNKYEEDVKLLKEMGANSYKFSISWPRILPHGDLRTINQKGIDYYNKLINCLISNGIEPIVVIYHWDFPADLSQYSWKNEEMIEHLVNYAGLCFESFGDRVKRWITINEPWIHTIVGYDLGLHPPNIKEPESVYLVIHNLLKAHASAYRLYETQFKQKQNGKVGISLDCWGTVPATNSLEDKEAVKVALEFKFGSTAHPLFFGCYPKSMRERIDRKSLEEGREESRLPKINAEWSKIMKGSVDFIGLNHYTCEVVSATKAGVPDGVDVLSWSSSKVLGVSADTEVFTFHDPKWPGSQTWWLKVTPEALRVLLNYIKVEYGNPEVIITENGFPDKIEKMEDTERSDYFEAYLNELLKAVKLDGCNVTGYMAWGLLDGWEWTSGHDVTFGVHHVDFQNPNRPRTPRLSAKTLKRIFENKGFLNS